LAKIAFLAAKQRSWRSRPAARVILTFLPVLTPCSPLRISALETLPWLLVVFLVRAGAALGTAPAGSCNQPVIVAAGYVIFNLTGQEQHPAAPAVLPP
jgi:hypothetical protein